MAEATRADVCVIACAELFRNDGEIMASPMGTMPLIGARLARLSFAEDLLLSDGEALLFADVPAIGATAPIEGWIPYRKVFDVVAAGTRHVVMGANQLDRFGNQNISHFGAHEQPSRMMFGPRGGPGNTINHRTSYWVPKHGPRVFSERVDFVSGVGTDRAHGAGMRFHDLYRVVSNLAVLDFGGPEGSMRLVSVHPGVTVGEVQAATSFALHIDGHPDGEVPTTRVPTDAEFELLERIDPRNFRGKEVPE
jgi:acyl CoA:acetate/3-ketoacid CoA transferase beta subunit